MITPEQIEAAIEAGYIDRETNMLTVKGVLQGLYGMTPGTPIYEAYAPMLEAEPSGAIEREAAELRAKLEENRVPERRANVLRRGIHRKDGDA